MLSFPVPVLSFLFVSFRPSSLRFPQLFHECFPFAFAFGLFRFPSGSFRPLLFRLRLLGLCFFLSAFFLSPPHSGFLSAPLLLSLLRFSPFFPAWFPMLSFPVLRTRLPVRFLSSFPVSLPQLFHRCFPSFPLPCVRFSSGLSACFLLSFVCFCSLLTTQPSALSFPFFPFSPVGGSFGALWFLSSPSFPLPSGLFPCLPSDSGTQLPALPFSASLFRVTGTTQLLASCFQLGHSPLLSL